MYVCSHECAMKIMSHWNGKIICDKRGITYTNTKGMTYINRRGITYSNSSMTQKMFEHLERSTLYLLVNLDFPALSVAVVHRNGKNGRNIRDFT